MPGLVASCVGDGTAASFGVRRRSPASKRTFGEPCPALRPRPLLLLRSVGFSSGERIFRFVADRITAALARGRGVEAIALYWLCCCPATARGAALYTLQAATPADRPRMQRISISPYGCRGSTAWMYCGAPVAGLSERSLLSAVMDRPSTKSRFSCLSLAPTAILAGFVSSGSARPANVIVSPPGAAINLFLKQHDAFSFCLEAIAEGAAIRLFDRIGAGSLRGLAIYR